MKVFRNDKVYVQKEDLKLLYKWEGFVPISILETLCKNGVFFDEVINKQEYVEFSIPWEVKFFKDEDWIIDYDEVNNLSLEEIEQEFNKTNNELSVLTEKYSQLSEEEKFEKTVILHESNFLNDKLFTLFKVYYCKSHNIELPLPKECKETLPKELGISKLIRKLKIKK